MDSTTVSRRNHKKGNKENDLPALEIKSFIKRDKMPAVPFQLKNNNNNKEETIPKTGVLKAKGVDSKSTSAATLKRVKTFKRDGQGAAATEKRQTHSQVFPGGQAVKDKKIIEDTVAKPLATVTSKPVAGMYKGKVVQSKIGAIWKTSATVGRAEPRTLTTKAEVQNVTKVRSTSVADLPRHATQKPAQTRVKSVLDKPAQLSRPTVTSRPPAGSLSARPSTRTVHVKLTSTTCRNSNMVFTKKNAVETSKPSIPGKNKVNKPSVSSALSQYRFTMETAEERRAKLTGWLASKGKTLKRPAMTRAAPSTAKVSAKPKPDPKPRPQPAEQYNPQLCLKTHEPDMASAAHCANTQRTEITTHSQTPAIMNTTLDLLENSDPDLLVEPQDNVDNIVVNLCEALEAMVTPSGCIDEPLQMTDMCSNVEVEEDKAEDKCKEEQTENKMPQDVSGQLQVEQMKEEESGDEEDEEDDGVAQSGDDSLVETTPQKESASVVKYSVKTTPYLQSVKKTIDEEASSSVSRRKSNIKDLKFLTPVRRSSRIQRKSSYLPTMLLDHDPCVTSLAELVKLDDDPNAYIYRKNPALADDLPDN